MNRWCVEPPSISAPRFTWSRKSCSSASGSSPLGSLIGCLDGRRDRAVHCGDPLRGGPVQSAQYDDAGVVGLVAVVQDEVIAGGVVAEGSYVGVCALGLPVQGERWRQGSGFLAPAVIGHVDGHG